MCLGYQKLIYLSDTQNVVLVFRICINILFSKKNNYERLFWVKEKNSSFIYALLLLSEVANK